MLKRFGSELLLLLTAAIWGFAFVAQKQGMENLDPFMYNGIRFALGALFVGLISLKTGKPKAEHNDTAKTNFVSGIANPDTEQFAHLSYKVKLPFGAKTNFVSGITNPATQQIANLCYKAALPFPWVLGIVLFLAASLQQLGMVWTTAGNAGFITGLYIIIVPLLGIYRHQKISLNLKIAIGLALIGLYLINSNQGIEVSLGNGIVLISALFWGIHVQMIDKYTNRYDTFYLAFAQFSVCAVLSLLTGLVYNIIPQPDFLIHKEFWQSVYQAALPIFYGGLISVGIAYTLQVYAQKRTKPTNAAIILCLESVFALVGGWWLLSETVTPARLAGTALLLGAMLLSLCKHISVSLDE